MREAATRTYGRTAAPGATGGGNTRRSRFVGAAACALATDTARSAPIMNGSSARMPGPSFGPSVAPRKDAPSVKGSAHQPLDGGEVWAAVADIADDASRRQMELPLAPVLARDCHDGAGVARTIACRVELMHLARAFIEHERRHVVEECRHQILRRKVLR